MATGVDLVLPVFSGRLVDAIASHHSAHAVGLRLGVRAIVAMTGLIVLLLAARYAALMGIIRLTLRLMSRFASDAFWRVQRFSTDWHANNFAGSIVRRITRGMWAVDIMDDTLLLAMWPALLVLAGSSLILGLRWPSMGLIVAAGSTIYVGTSIALSLRYVAPAARLSNAQDTRIGGAIADAVTCNTVVKSFGAEAREDLRLGKLLNKWHHRTARTWVFATRSGESQSTLLLALRTAITSYAVLLWWRGKATPGDVTFVLTSYFIVHAYLRDIGQHVRNLQRCVNEMEEMVEFQSQPLGVVDHPDARPIRIDEGEIVFDRVTFQYVAQLSVLDDVTGLVEGDIARSRLAAPP